MSEHSWVSIGMIADNFVQQMLDGKLQTKDLGAGWSGSLSKRRDMITLWHQPTNTKSEVKIGVGGKLRKDTFRFTAPKSLDATSTDNIELRHRHKIFGPPIE